MTRWGEEEVRESGYTDSNTLAANWTNTLVALPLLKGAQTMSELFQRSRKTKKKPWVKHPRAEGRSQTGGNSDSSNQLPASQQGDAPQGSPLARGDGGGATSRQSPLFMKLSLLTTSAAAAVNLLTHNISDGFLERTQAQRNPTGKWNQIGWWINQSEHHRRWTRWAGQEELGLGRKRLLK